MDNVHNIYVIQSRVDKRLYVGISKNIEKRLKEHNSGAVFSTKGYRPWNIAYKENAKNRMEARKREKYLKSGCGKEFLKSFIPR